MVDKLLIIENIIDYKYKFNKCNIIVNKCYDITNVNYKNEISYYFILDSYSKDLGFWIYESFIFIKLLNDLNKNLNNNIKILTKKDNNFIKNLLKYFNINNEIVDKIDNYNNICYSPVIYSIYYNHNKLKDDTYFNYHLNNFIDYITNNLDNDCKSNKIVLINDKNDINLINKINNDNGYILDNKNDNIKHNLSILNKSEIIYLYYNSSFYFNTIFLKGKTIFIVEDDINRPNGIHVQLCGNPFILYLFDIISNNNKVSSVNFQ
jgi:hypothetical protein